jgi:ABC-type sugar transport system substrate-binding protein
MKKAITVLLVLVVLFSATGNIFAAGAKEESKGITLGMIVPSMANEFWVRVAKFSQKASEELGFKIIVLDSRDSGDTQIKNAENLISQKVDGLIFTGYYDSGRRILQMTERANIPAIVMDTSVTGVEPKGQFQTYEAFIGPSNKRAGYAIADFLIKNMKTGASGKKEIVALYGTLGTSVAEERRVGLEEALKDNPDVKLVAAQTGDFRRDEGMKVMENFLIAHPNVTAVWCANDEMALGAINAIENVGREKEIIVGGMDLNDEAVDAMLSGRYSFSAGGHWLMGGFAATILYDYLNGYEINERDVQIVLAEVASKKDAITLQEKWLPYPAWDFKAHSKTYSGKDVKQYTELKVE